MKESIKNHEFAQQHRKEAEQKPGYKTLEEIRKSGISEGEFFAIGVNGEKYPASYSAKYCGGVMFFCIPSNVEIWGYSERV